jgi:aminomethyltransferase
MPFPSPVHERMVALNETWKYKDWAGIVAPCRYVENHVYEYTAFRQSAGLLDVSPLFKYEVRGPDAARFLSSVTSKDVSKLALGRVTYLCWCDDDGKVVDDGTVSRLAPEHFRMTAAERQYAWLTRLAAGFDVAIEDVSRTLAALAVQGPRSRAVVAACIEPDAREAVERLRFFGTTAARVKGRDARVSRTGYTGDLGYEVWCAWEDAPAVWDALVDAGRPHRLVPAGLDALDMTRIEAGFVLLGVDYFSAPHVTLDEKRSTPFEIGLDWTLELDRPAFVGQRALLAARAAGPARTLVGLEFDWVHLESLYRARGLAPEVGQGASRESLPVTADGRLVGRVSSSTWSPTLKRWIALASVQREFAEPGRVLEVEHTLLFERRSVRARVVPRPFFDPERKRRP